MIKPALPNLESALGAWAQPLTFVEVVKELRDFKEVETYQARKTRGVRSPLRPQELALKPEGQRAWKWEKIHASPTLQLKIDAIIVFNDRRYRVMSKNDYAEYGYVEYDIVEDFQK